MSRTLIRRFSLLLDQAVKRFVKVRMLFDSSEPLQTTVKEYLARVRCGSIKFEEVRKSRTILNSRKVLLYSSSKWNESNHDQTTLTAACSGCAVVWRGSNELNSDQTALSAACSDFAQVLRCSNELNYNQTTLTV